MRFFLTVFLATFVASSAVAREYAPRVVSPHNADAYSMRTFRKFHRWKDLTGDALAWEVYRYLVDTRTGVFHMNEVNEGGDVLTEYSNVRDPVKIINVYGYAYCGIFGPVMAGIWQDMGEGSTRTLSLPTWSHMTSEVFYDGRWHYMDLDVRAVFRRPDGSLASMAEARSDPSLWKNRGPLFFPNDSLEDTRKTYLKTAVHHYHGFNQSGHTMDFVLRQGETLTRWWKPQGDRWHHDEKYNRMSWLRKLIEKDPVGPKPNHRHFTVHNYANGRFVYHPNLTERSTDFADGAYDWKNVRPGEDGLTLSEPGDGYAVFEVRTPYIIVPAVGDLETRTDDRQASVVSLDAEGVALSISLDNGISWKALERPSGAAKIDLTQHVAGKYGYLLRMNLSGRPDAAVVRSLRITTWVQVAPAALPSLRRGVNRMVYRTGDHYGLNTRLVKIASNGSDPESFEKHLWETQGAYDPTQKTGRIRGSVVAMLNAPPHTKIAWFTATGAFRTHQQEAAKNTRNAIEYAVDKPADFQPLYRADVPLDTSHWHYNAAREVRLDKPADRVFVRYTGDPSLNNYGVFAHCLDDGRASDSPTTVTHVWSEGGVAHRKTVSLRSGDAYEIECREDPTDEMIEISVPTATP